MNVILASQSPRRRELLGFFRFPFTVKVADIDETMDPSVSPVSEVARISHKKALAIPRGLEDVVIAADTIVVCQGRVLGKPRSREEATEMLTLLSGRDHQVMTGLTVLKGDKVITHTEITDVQFRPLSEQEIEDYVNSKDPMDKAGAYGIQSEGCVLVEKIDGDFFAVMGLPVARLKRALKMFVDSI